MPCVDERYKRENVQFCNIQNQTNEPFYHSCCCFTYVGYWDDVAHILIPEKGIIGQIWSTMKSIKSKNRPKRFTDCRVPLNCVGNTNVKANEEKPGNLFQMNDFLDFAMKFFLVNFQSSNIYFLSLLEMIRYVWLGIFLIFHVKGPLKRPASLLKKWKEKKKITRITDLWCFY